MKQNGAGWEAGSESKELTAIAGANNMLDEITGSLSSLNTEPYLGDFWDESASFEAFS